MRVSITCEQCGQRHRLERNILEAGPIFIICHDCEMPLKAELSEDDLIAQQAVQYERGIN